MRNVSVSKKVAVILAMSRVAIVAIVAIRRDSPRLVAIAAIRRDSSRSPRFVAIRRDSSPFAAIFRDLYLHGKRVAVYV